MSADGAAPRRRPKDRRARILDAAAELFAARGFAAVSMQDIGERTGITGGAVYRHFSGKDALLQELVLDSLAAFERAQTVRSESTSRGVPPLRASLESAVDAIAERPGRVAVFLRERHRVTQGATPETRRREKAVDRFWADVIRSETPGLTAPEVAVRQQARLGVVGSLSRSPASVSSPRARQLVVNSLEAALRVPSVQRTSADHPRSRWKAPESRRQQIVKVAVRLFEERGFHGAGLNEVGDAVGITGPSIYEYFESKVDILLYAYDIAGSFVVAGAMAAVRSAESADDALDRLVESYARVCESDVHLISVTRHEASSVPADEVPRLARRRQDLYEMWTSVLRQVRPEVSQADALLLVRSTFALVATAARTPARSLDLTATNVAMARSFLTGSAPG